MSDILENILEIVDVVKLVLFFVGRKRIIGTIIIIISETSPQTVIESFNIG